MTDETQADKPWAGDMQPDPAAGNPAATPAPLPAATIPAPEPAPAPPAVAEEQRREDELRIVDRHLPHALAGIQAYIRSTLSTLPSQQKAAAERCCDLIDLALSRRHG